MSFLFIQNESHGNVDNVSRLKNADFDARMNHDTSSQFYDTDFTRGQPFTQNEYTRGWWDVQTVRDNASDIWFHFKSAIYTSVGVTLLIGDTSKAWFSLKIDNERLHIVNDSGTTIASSDRAAPNGVSDFDIKINFNTGSYTIFIDGTDYGSGTLAYFTGFDIKSKMSRMLSDTGSFAMSEGIICEGLPTIGMRVLTLAPSALSPDNTMEGVISDINGITLTDGGISSASAGDFLNEYSDPVSSLDLNTYDIKAVNLSSVVRSDTGFESNYVKSLIRTGGNVYEGTNPLISNTSSNLGSMVDTFTTNPATGSDWTAADITGLEAGIRLEIQPFFQFEMGNDGTYYGFSIAGIGTALLNGSCFDRTGANTPYFLLLDSSDNRLDFAFGAGGGGTVDGNTVSIDCTFKSSDGSTYNIVVPRVSSSYVKTDSAFINWAKTQVGNVITMYVAFP